MNGTSLKQILSGDYPRNSRLSRWDRKVGKTVMNLALFLALAGAAVALFDGGFSSHVEFPKGVQASFARQHWGHINLDAVAPGVREKLPKNVDLWSPTLSAGTPNVQITRCRSSTVAMCAIS